MNTYMYTYVYVYMYMYLYIYTYFHIYIHMYVQGTCVHKYVCLYVVLPVVFVCVYIYIYARVRMYSFSCSVHVCMYASVGAELPKVGAPAASGPGPATLGGSWLLIASPLVRAQNLPPNSGQLGSVRDPLRGAWVGSSELSSP